MTQTDTPTEEVRSNHDLAADNERLREALKEIADYAASCKMSVRAGSVSFGRLQQIAETALEGR